MDCAGLSCLLTPGGWSLLESLPPYQESTAMVTAERLRRDGHDSVLVSAALTQSRLRLRGRTKFGPFADGMLFTAQGLEQATRLAVAARHAQRFASAGITRVADLGCGIGGDAMALAGLDLDVLAVERDELTAAVATVNLRHWPEAVVRREDLAGTDLGDVDGVFLDPSRRTSSSGGPGGSRRIFDPESTSPPLSWVLGLSSRLPAVGAKVAPGIAHRDVPAGAEAQWVSVDGDVVEAGLWFGPLAREEVRRAALMIRDDGAHEISDVALPAPRHGPVAGYLYEPDGAVIRAGLVGHVAGAVDGWLLDPTIAYVTAEHPVATPLARRYAVEDVLPFGLKVLRTYLRDRGVGRLTIKKRGTAVEPEHLRRQLRLTGPNGATIVLTRVAGQQSVLLVRPLG